MSNIFISYNRKSEATVRTLAADIEALGHEVWFDQDLSGGQAWWDQILATVRACEVFIFALAPESLNSTACEREYRYAEELGKPILPILIADEVSTNLLPPSLSAIQIVDYRDQDDRGAAFRLARAFMTVPPAGPLPDPLPEPPEVPISYLGGLTEQIGSASTLSLQEQSVLVIDLKRSLRDSDTTNDAQILLERLRKRRDLFATTADEIDELLASTASDLPPSPSALDPAEPEKPLAQEVKERPAAKLKMPKSKPPEKRTTSRPPKQPVPAAKSRKRKPARHTWKKIILYIFLGWITINLIAFLIGIAAA